MLFMHCSAVAYVGYSGRVNVTDRVIVVNTASAGKHMHPSVTVHRLVHSDASTLCPPYVTCLCPGYFTSPMVTGSQIVHGQSGDEMEQALA